MIHALWCYVCPRQVICPQTGWGYGRPWLLGWAPCWSSVSSSSVWWRDVSRLITRKTEATCLYRWHGIGCSDWRVGSLTRVHVNTCMLTCACWLFLLTRAQQTWQNKQDSNDSRDNLKYCHSRELPQIKKLSRQKFRACRDKHVFVAIKYVFCRVKVATDTFLSPQKFWCDNFVPTKVCFVGTNILSSRQKRYLWQLPPIIKYTPRIHSEAKVCQIELPPPPPPRSPASIIMPAHTQLTKNEKITNDVKQKSSTGGLGTLGLWVVSVCTEANPSKLCVNG